MKAKKSNKHYHVMLHDDGDPNFLEHAGQFAFKFEAHDKAKSLFTDQIQKQPGRASQSEKIAIYRAAPGIENSKFASVTECRIDMHGPMSPVVTRARVGRSLKSRRSIRSK